LNHSWLTNDLDIIFWPKTTVGDIIY
jgi:hypothetical protein